MNTRHCALTVLVVAVLARTADPLGAAGFPWAVGDRGAVHLPALRQAQGVLSQSKDAGRTGEVHPRTNGNGPGRTHRPILQTPEWLSRLTSWLQAVNEHTPGLLDAAARLTGFSTEADLGEARTDFLALVAICRREMGRTGTLGFVVYRDTQIRFLDLRRLLTLTDEEAATGNANRVLKRAAVLHADVAMLVTPLLPDRIGCSGVSTILVTDGNRVGAGCVDIHWIHGRLLLDAVRPGPDRDEFVRRWYVAAATYFLEMGDYANAKPHLEQARLLFRSDPDVLFARGCYQEAFASPPIQAVAVDSGANPRDARSYVEEAEDLFGRAVKGNPQFVEARVHRGNTLLLLARDRDAVEELRLAAAAAKGPALSYYAELFLGRAEEAAGSPAAARARYLRAAELFPTAQSPRLALALLARRAGDRAGAQDALRQLVELPRARGATADPWAFYYRWQDVSFSARFTALHALLAAQKPQ